MNQVRITGNERDDLRKALLSCRLCPRQCGVNRAAGEKGICGLDDGIILARALPHHGEEPPISGTRGAGTLFLSSCNLRCRFCQNHQISHGVHGKTLTPLELARHILALENQGCHNIEAVTPTPQLPQLIDSLQLAWDAGLTLPFVYNCGGYENPGIIRMLDGLVDIYLPDFKYGNEENAHEWSGVRDYPRFALESIREMMNQVGPDLELDDGGIATRGMIIRHLILPGHIENSIQVLSLIRDHLSRGIPLSLMSQYTPSPAMKDHPSLGRRVTREEYENVVNHALDMGFEQLFVQEVDDRNLCPDFSAEAPFQWTQEGPP
ncbi:MAG TPA: radical SAM protein [Syntrophales bacterium]|nr:radical SAM protein [Syntrophales bacterium]